MLRSILGRMCKLFCFLQNKYLLGWEAECRLTPLTCLHNWTETAANKDFPSAPTSSGSVSKPESECCCYSPAFRSSLSLFFDAGQHKTTSLFLCLQPKHIKYFWFPRLTFLQAISLKCTADFTQEKQEHVTEFEVL